MSILQNGISPKQHAKWNSDLLFWEKETKSNFISNTIEKVLNKQPVMFGLNIK